MANALVQRATDESNEVERKIQEFFDKVNDALSWVPGPLTHLIQPILKGLEEIRQKVAEFWNRLLQLREQPGDADALNDVAEQWVNSVGNPLGDIAANVGPTKMRASVEWEGSAAEAYKILIPTQGEGLNGIKGLASQINSSLKSLADSIDSFWLAITCALVGFGIAILGAIAAAFTVVGIPAAIGVILTAVAAGATLITVTIQTLNSHLDTIDSEQRTLKQKIHDLGGTWTKSETDMTDASVSDGDESDWRINQ